MLKKANDFFITLFCLGYLDETNLSTVKQQSNFLYWNLHYHIFNLCINVSHTCIPNEEVGGAMNVYVNKYNIPI